MKIYTELVYDLKTGSIIEESFFEYKGIVAQCKSGGGSTTSVDKEYNKRMAAIAEAQQAMAMEYFNYYKYGSGGWETPRPDTSYQAWEEDPEGEGKASYSHWAEGKKSEWDYSKKWVPDEGAVGLQQYEQEQMRGAMGLLPGQLGLAKEQIEAQREFVGLQRPLARKYFGEITKGVDVRDEMGKAKTDVQQAFSGVEGEMRRSAGRMGIDPGSGRYAGTQSRMLSDKAKGLAGAGTMGRRYAEEKTFERLRGAMGQ